VRSIYHEVHLAMSNNQPVLAGIGIRALVEAVCAEEEVIGMTLEKRIDDLATKNVLTGAAAATLHRTRVLGNTAAHEVAPPNEEQLEAAMAVAEQLLMNVYILPAIGEQLPPAPAKQGKAPLPSSAAKTLGDSLHVSVAASKALQRAARARRR
jgi:hypothetical protein